MVDLFGIGGGKAQGQIQLAGRGRIGRRGFKLRQQLFCTGMVLCADFDFAQSCQGFGLGGAGAEDFVQRLTGEVIAELFFPLARLFQQLAFDTFRRGQRAACPRDRKGECQRF